MWRRLWRGRAGYLSVVEQTFTVLEGDGRLVSTAIHAGHQIRSEIASHIGLDDAERLREEDPYTDLVLGDLGTRIVAHRSRFEVDLNRPRETSVYLTPDDAWGLEVWRRPLPQEVAERSRSVHDAFYALLAEHLDRLAADGPFLVLDVHSYNHRRSGPDNPPAEPHDNPEVNVGTGALDRALWGPVIDSFVDELGRQRVAGHDLDVRENVRFRGGFLSRWVANRYPETGCVLALELKKTFMDEWTGRYDPDHLAQLRRAVVTATEPTLEALASVVRP
jgi:N-formylglutamate deformylase